MNGGPVRRDYKLEGCKQEVYDLQAQLEGSQRLLVLRSGDLEAMRLDRDYCRAQRDRWRTSARQALAILQRIDYDEGSRIDRAVKLLEGA